ncbi:LacI family DNA-binding transcriptional regulator [Aquiflexum gelatinilyticum]|uniref:LacI family transcriptional regulator n=1 Tax=Aquiflexum gelatinilyticum TaxID=2961943 RepID=A0A9X2T1Y5_9BACT|nr:LacI family DNA-binding transcriptional regulator [Aquiflexum gelatinilyticum]MCR9015005.1 LacI family transcriptional regulator [Aquiflexum gelatinilyticum]MCS4434060.1 LacI family transcriptional regulator [Aquiflexum gelatinilyticum]
MNKETTIYDIAKDLGVSPTTVSRALNNHPAVNENTRKKIFDAANKSGYQSNVFAANLRNKRTKKIGVIVPRLNSSFQSSVLAGMEKVANDSGFNLIISQSLESYEKEVSNALTMFNSRVDGLLVSIAGDSENMDHFTPFLRKGIPLLFYDRIADYSNTAGITIDNFQAAYNATKHLIEQGCKKIVHVLRSTKNNVYADRLRGYKYAFLENEIPFNPDLVIFTDLIEEKGEEIVKQILKMNPLPDGLFVSNDSFAANCIRHLKLEGIRIPEDIAVVGFNNEAISRLVEPNITTINYPGYEMGELAMKNLINHLENPSEGMLHNTNKITLRSELIIRASSKKK